MNGDATTGGNAESVSPQEARRYREQGWWLGRTISSLIRGHAAERPDQVAYFAESGALTWAGYDSAADGLAARLAALCPLRGSRVAVYLPDGPLLHIAYLACERAGLVIVGIPERAGDRELAHLLGRTGAGLLVCPPNRRGRTGAEITAAARSAGAGVQCHVELDRDTFAAFRWDGGRPEPVVLGSVPGPADLADRALRPDELWLLNSTSGTTGLPKCVRQVSERWAYFVRLAVDAAALTADEVVMSLVPGPFGFGLWTAHFAPAMLGVPCALRERFDAAASLRAVAEHRVTVLACVTTQFVMMLDDPALDEADLSSLRVLYTGGERVPPEKAREWERRTGSTVLQFYGSNEIGPFSCTTLADGAEDRLTTVGRIVPGLDVRLYDAGGADITGGGAPGQPGGRGPGSCDGYWNDPAADALLYSADGHLLMPDLVTIDERGYVRIVGRSSDLIIRGGKNIGAAAVEADVGAHPNVAMVAAIAVPDPVFGERVCAVVSLRDPGRPLTLPGLAEFLAGRGVSKEYFPEYLAVLDELPVSIGGKIAKAQLRSRLDELLPDR